MNILNEVAGRIPEHDRLMLGGVVGSFNYGLEDSLSDTDIRYYVMPTVDDLLRGRKRRRVFMDGPRDIQLHDIRRLPYFLQMGDLNQISVLFSPAIYLGEPYTVLSDLLLDQREDIAKAVSISIYSWGRSMFEKKMGQLDSFRLGEEVYERNGYNTKAAAQAVYHVKMIERYIRNLEYDVKNPLEKALNCRDIREEILEIKDGKYTREEFLKIADDVYTPYSSMIEANTASRIPSWVIEAINKEIKKHI